MHRTNDLNDGYMGSGKHLRRAIEKYGIENFSKEILHIFDNPDDMKKKEKEIVVISEQTYNLCEGGHGGFGYINRNKLNHKFTDQDLIKAKEARKTEEAKQKFKERMKSVNSNIDKRYRCSLTSKGKPRDTSHMRTEDILNKKREIYRQLGHSQGEKNSQFGTCWITNGIENMKIKKALLDEFIIKGWKKGRVV